MRFFQYKKIFLTTILVQQIIGMFLLWIPIAYADYTVTASDSIGSAVINAATNHDLTITNDIGVASGTTITITVPSSYTMPNGLDYTDFDFIVNSSQRTLAASSGTNIDGISVSGHTITITIGSAGAGGAFLNAELLIGTNATSQSNGTRQITNPSSATSYTYTVAIDNHLGLSGSVNFSQTISTSVPDMKFFTQFTVILFGGWMIYRGLTKSVISSIKS
jgi:hypothetical protein